MNDKLEELMYQAGLTAQGCWDEMDSYDHTAIEKFAELIVKECMKLNSKELSITAIERLLPLYEEHFGVKG